MNEAQRAELEDCKRGLEELKAALRSGKKRELIQLMAKGAVDWNDTTVRAMAETLAANFLSDATIMFVEAKYGTNTQ